VGVNLSTAAEFIEAGAAALGIGGELVQAEALKSNKPELIVESARKFLEIVATARAKTVNRRSQGKRVSTASSLTVVCDDLYPHRISTLLTSRRYIQILHTTNIRTKAGPSLSHAHVLHRIDKRNLVQILHALISELPSHPHP